jgi:hypothetical protein
MQLIESGTTDVAGLHPLKVMQQVLSLALSRPWQAQSADKIH